MKKIILWFTSFVMLFCSSSCSLGDLYYVNLEGGAKGIEVYCEKMNDNYECRACEGTNRNKTDDEIKRLFACFKSRDFCSIRNYCIVALMLDSGLRLNEVVTLERGKIHIAEGYIIVNGKGNKERIVPLGLNSKKALLRYYSIIPGCEQKTLLFLKDNLTPISREV